MAENNQPTPVQNSSDAVRHFRPNSWKELTHLPVLSDEQARYAGVLADARILLWTAQVSREGDGYRWKLEIAPESLRSPLVAYTAYRREGYLWNPSFALDFALMEHTWRDALARGLDSYQQQFRVTDGHRTIWLDELVRITPLGTDEWRLSGLVREITERKLAQDAERRIRDELNSLLAHARCMLFHASVREGPEKLTWEFSFVPSALQEQIFQHPPGRITSRLYRDFDVPQLDAMNQRATHAIRSGAPGYQQEFSMTRRSDNRTFWIREYVTILPPVDGRWELSGVMIDVTSEKLSELARRDTDRYFRQILENIDCIVWHGEVEKLPWSETAYEWTVTAPPSRFFRRLFKREPTTPVSFWTPETTPEYHDLDKHWRAAVASNASTYQHEFRYIDQGTVTWLRESVTILTREPNKVRLAGVVVDITAAKEAELQLSAEKERLAVTLRAMEESVVTVDLSGAITFLNRAAEKLLKVTASEALGRPFSALAHLQVGEPAGPIEWPLDGILSVNLPPDAQLVPRDSEPVRLEGCVAPLVDPGSVRAGAVIVLRDVSERYLLQKQLQRASTLESVGLLAGGIAHDFNNILTALIANLSLAEADAPAGSELAWFLREAHTASDRAAALARQLLTFAKGGDPLMAAVNLADVVREVTRFTLRGMRVDHVLDLPADLWPAQADRGQIAQILQNLVLNAAQSMPRGGTVRIAARNEVLPSGASSLAAGRYLCVTVADTGMGIAPEAIDKIFTPYFTTKSNGSGLGLAVVYSIVKKHRGSIDVASTVGEGTTFTLRLPAAEEDASVPVRTASPLPNALSGRVLVMDDEEAILRVLESFLRQLGLEVELTKDGDQAVTAYRAGLSSGRPHDVVIMDLTVPGKKGGREAIAELRKIDPTVRAIVASGYSSDPVLSNYRAYGFSEMAAKPFDISVLAHKIRDLLERRPGVKS